MGMVKRGRWRFGSLYWRVTVSYFLVTLVAALTIEAATVIGPAIREVQHVEAMPLDGLLSEREAPQVAPYLEQTPPDKEALQGWLLGPLIDTISRNGYSQPSLVAIVDQHGQVLAAVSCSSSKHLTSGSEQCAAADMTQADDPLALSSAQDAIQAALAGDKQPVDVVFGVDKQVIIAVAILTQDGQVIGALVAIGDGSASAGVTQAISLSDIGELAFIFLHDLQPAGFYFVLLATAIGTVAGLLISGGITRRLRRITLAAAAWSQGEFQVAVRDPSRDEVGQLARDLDHMAGQVQTLLASRQELAVVEERNRLARELHDSVKQHVFANALLVRAARKLLPRDLDKAQAHLAEAEALADQAQQELIALIRALRPAALADKGLGDVVQAYAADWSRRMGITVDVRIQGQRATPLEVEEALFRVAQEALANVARHSGAEQVEVRLAWTGGQVHLTIRDTGKGFDALRAPGKGLGLANMRERVELLGGTLAISSSADGTTLEASVPMVFSSPREMAEVADE